MPRRSAVARRAIEKLKKAREVKKQPNICDHVQASTSNISVSHDASFTQEFGDQT